MDIQGEGPIFEYICMPKLESEFPTSQDEQWRSQVKTSYVGTAWAHSVRAYKHAFARGPRAYTRHENFTL